MENESKDSVSSGLAVSAAASVSGQPKAATRVNYWSDYWAGHRLATLIVRITASLLCIGAVVLVAGTQSRVPLTGYYSWFAQLPAALLFFTILVFLVGGIVKGIAGVGMAMIAVPLLSTVYNPALAIVLVSVPLVVCNFRQGIVNADLKYTWHRYYPLIVVMTVTMVVAASLSIHFPASIISISLGLMAITFAVINLGARVPVIPAGRDLPAQIIAGIAAGIAGGLSGLVVIPLVFYMIARDVNRESFVSVTGLLFLISGLALLTGYVINDVLTIELLVLSCIATIPALIGTLLGEKLGNRINQSLFRKVVLYLLLIIGIRIIITEWI